MNWKKYEQEIYKYFSESYPETSIKYDQRILGKYSKVERQIDILIEGRIAGYILKINEYEKLHNKSTVYFLLI